MKAGWAWPAMALCLCGCAQVRDPQGGPVDTVAPLLLRSDPPAGSVNTRPTVILLQFSEAVKLDRVRDRMVVSPPLDPLPDVRSDGRNGVRITLRGPLEPNTTYSIDLSDAVVDVTEGNRCLTARYVFATGPVLDSLSIAGTVRHAFSDVWEKEIAIILQPADSADRFLRAKPLWMTRSDSNGRFRIDHLPSGRYALFALRDRNGNQRYDLPTEEIAFAATPVVLPGDTTPIHLRLFLERSAQQQVTHSRVTEQGAWHVVFARPAQDPALLPLDWEGGRLTWSHEVNRGRDTVVFWPSDTTLLTGRRFTVRDAAEILDTVTYRQRSKVPYHLGCTTAASGPSSEGTRIFETTRPIASIQPERMMLIGADGEALEPPQVDPVGLRRFRLRTTLHAGQQATLLLLPKAIIDTWGGSNDTLRFTWGEPAVDDLGTLTVTLGNLPVSHTGLILHLSNTQDHAVHQSRLQEQQGPITWERLPPGTYRLWLLADENGNGVWDTGALQEGLQPEHVWRDPQTVTVRAGWDMRVNWDLPR